MAITVTGGATTHGTDTINDHILTHGLTINENDLILFFNNIDGLRSNQTAVPSSDATIYSADTLSGHVEIKWKKAGASEPSTYTWSVSTAERGQVAIIVLAGQDLTTPIDSDNQNSGGADNTAVLTSLTPTVDNCAVVAYVALQEGNSAGADSLNTWPASITGAEEFDGSSEGSGSGAKSHGASAIVQTTAAAVSGNVNINHGDSTLWETFVIAVAPATAVAQTRLLSIIMQQGLFA